jgi:hypothetical protein
MRLALTIVIAVVALAAFNSQADNGGGPRAASTSTASTAGGLQATPASLPVMTVYKSPTCGCCQSWVDAVKAAGFTVEVHDVDDVTPVKDDAGVPADKRSCHTAIIGGYAIEGHVPPATIKKFLAEHSTAAGLAVPGMPSGSPGMEMPGQEPDHYDVIAFQSDGKSSVYESH